MRTLLKMSIPVEAGNQGIRSGKLLKALQAYLTEVKPEAAYFTEEGGERTAYIVVDLKEPSQIPAMLEPLFLAANARVEIHPAMNAEDLAKAGPALERAVKNYG